MGRKISDPVGRLIPLLGMAALLAGCSDPSGGRQAVSGTITFKGSPLDRGIITFYPASPATGTQAGANIAGGKYSIPREKGLLPGTYKVSISSADGKTPDGPSNAPPGPSGNFASKERIPAEFNQNSNQEKTVTKDGPNTFDFDIP